MCATAELDGVKRRREHEVFGLGLGDSLHRRRQVGRYRRLDRLRNVRVHFLPCVDNLVSVRACACACECRGACAEADDASARVAWCQRADTPASSNRLCRRSLALLRDEERVHCHSFYKNKVCVFGAAHRTLFCSKHTHTKQRHKTVSSCSDERTRALN